MLECVYKYMDQTRMHFSRMCTACLLPVSPSMHCSQGGYLVPGVYLVPGGVPGLGGVPGPGNVEGVPGLGGVPGPRGCTWSWGEYQPRYSPLWTEFLTHAPENITLPQTSFAGGKKLGCHADHQEVSR